MKPVPPKGMAVPEADRRVLEAELSTLAQELKRLRERPETAALLPDVEIFYRAVDGAFRYGEFFDADDIPKARQLLATAASGPRRWPAARAPGWSSRARRRWATCRRIDGSVQPYGLDLPEGFRPRDGRALAAGRLVSRARREAVAR